MAQSERAVEAERTDAKARPAPAEPRPPPAAPGRRAELSLTAVATVTLPVRGTARDGTADETVAAADGLWVAPAIGVGVGF